MVDTIRSLAIKRRKSGEDKARPYSVQFMDLMRSRRIHEIRDSDLIKEVAHFCDRRRIDNTKLLDALLKKGFIKPIGYGWLELQIDSAIMRQ